MKRQFVDFLFTYLESNFNYLILRNYENLPEDEGHDIDLLIDCDEEKKIEILLDLIRDKFEIKIFNNYRYDNLRSHIIVFENDILHLDFFTAVQWNRVNLFDTSNLLSRKVRFKDNYYVMNPIDFQKYCWFLFIIRRGNLKKDKYINGALNWTENPAKKNDRIDIKNRSFNKNKFLLFIFFLRKSPVKFLLGSIKNIIFKVNKIVKPYGRIFDPESNINTINMCVKFCFIGQKKFINSKRDYLAVPKIFFAMADETAIILSNEFLLKNPEVEFILKKYFVRTSDNLQESIALTLNKSK